MNKIFTETESINYTCIAYVGVKLILEEIN